MQKLLTPSTEYTKKLDLGYKSLDYAGVYGDVQIVDGINFTRRPLGDDHYDLTSIYPFTVAKAPNFNTVRNQLNLDKRCVSLTLISDPLNDIWDIEYNYFRKHSFLNKPFKTHYVVNLQESSPEKYKDNHKKNLKKFKNKNGIVEILSHDKLQDFHINRFFDAYNGLVDKHQVGPKASTCFTLEQFKTQFFVPGSLLLSAWSPINPMEGFALFYIDGKDVYYHLSASSPHGYLIGSSYALINAAIKLFKQLGYRYLMLGSGAGVDSSKGLEYFKEGWGTFTKQNYIIGSIFNRTVYDRLSRGKTGDYFPLYRSP